MRGDLADVLFTEREIEEKVGTLGARIAEDYAGKRPLLVGILKGAAIFTADLARRIGEPAQLDFMSVSSYGLEASSCGKLTVKKDMDADISGRHVLICEDIVDSGLTMKCLLELLAARGPASLRLCALLSKPSRRQTAIEPDYCGWEVPDEFIVGYGLDYAERYRNLPCIGVLKPEIYKKR